MERHLLAKDLYRSILFMVMTERANARINSAAIRHLRMLKSGIYVIPSPNVYCKTIARRKDNAGGPKAMYNMMNKLDPESSKGRGII